MTWRKREIMDMAQEAGLIKTIDCCGVPDKFCGQDQWKGDLKAFAKLVREDEREACAKVCDDALTKIWEYHSAEVKSAAGNVCSNLATAIRARGQA